ncbi:MAG: hypothetical protein ACD_8C00042G0001 [uncultured bacterium]|nr:MAG: hypothetical protein ACD_8C00042G0001 [uncultured bacterium]
MGVEMAGIKILWTVLGEASKRNRQQHEEFFSRTGLESLAVGGEKFFVPHFDSKRSLWHFPEEVRGVMTFLMKISASRPETSAMTVLNFRSEAVSPSAIKSKAAVSKESFITPENELRVLAYRFEKQHRLGEFVLGRFCLQRLLKKEGAKVEQEIIWKGNDDCKGFICLSCGSTFSEKPYNSHKIPGIKSFCSAVPVPDLSIPDDLSHLRMEMFKLRRKIRRF